MKTGFAKWGLMALVIPVSVLLMVNHTWAQNGAPRLTQQIDERKFVTLRGNTRLEAKPANDRGAVADEFPLNHMFLQLRRSQEQEQALEQFIDQLHDPKSPNFQQWITAEEFGKRYGLAQQDLDTITGWLQSHGFAVGTVYANRMVISFSGNAGQVREAFYTGIHYLEVNGEKHIANMSDPQIPLALAPAITGIVSLNDFRPRAMHYPRANYTIGSGSSASYLVVPADLYTIYNFNPIFAAGYSGQGQTIVVVEDSNLYSTNDWNTFRATFGLATTYPNGSFSQVHPASNGTNNCTDPGANSADGEATLDAEWASAAAPNAAIELASCADSSTTFGGFIALQNLLNASDTPPAIVSISYGQSETEDGAAYNTAINGIYQQAVTQGVSVFVSAGDELAAENDENADAATHGINVNGWASTPYNVAVGGTDFSDTYAGSSSTYWNPTNGPSYGSALSYIPEIPWNNSCASVLLAQYYGYATTYGANGLCSSPYARDYSYGVDGGSGGPSGCATGTPLVSGVVGGTCAGYPKPSWQSIFGNPNDGVRDLPDVSLFAADGAWGHSYVYCYSDPGPMRNGASCTGPPSSWASAGGTSFSAPIMAGIQALINQYTGSRWGNPNPTYYALANVEYGTSGNANCDASNGNQVASACIFYDTTLGDIDAPCTGTTNCYLPSGTYGVLSTSDTSYQPAYPATVGWDFATGLGSVNVSNLVQAFHPSGPAPMAITFDANLISATSVTLTGFVDPNGAATTYYFQYGTSSSSLTSSTPSQSAGSGSALIAVSATLTSLTSNVPYYYRLVATNKAGTTEGSTLTFTPTALTAPTVTTLAANSLTATAAILNGSVDPNGLATSYYFQYGTSSGALVKSTAPQSLVAGISTVAVSAGLPSLNPGSTYYYQLVASNSAGTTSGQVLNFTAPGTLKVVIAGKGSGTVTSSPAGIDCTSTCSGFYASGTGVTLTASAAPGSTFTGWSGDYACGGGSCWSYGCSGTGTCIEYMPSGYSPSVQVTATFAPVNVPPQLANVPLIFSLFSNSVLAIDSNSVTTGGGGFTLWLQGANFASNAVVMWNGSPRPTTYVSSTQVSAAITAADVANAATDLVTVVNSSPNPATSAAQPFAVIAYPMKSAVVTSASIAPANDGSGNHLLALTCSEPNFLNQFFGEWNQQSLADTTYYLNPWIVDSIVPAAEFAAPPAAVTLNNYYGLSVSVFELQ